MKQPYRAKRLKRWSVIAYGLRALAYLLKAWPLLLLLTLLLSPRTPHLLWTYRSVAMGPHRLDRDCLYLGIHGAVRHQPGRRCPLIALIDPDKP
ncbi:MAG: hypothetical protein Tsb002_03540 [Wenzhouxiangellaceae bacterium]